MNAGSELDSAGEISRLLSAAATGNKAAEAKVFELLYPELRRIAAAFLAKERADHTLQPTALVHEVFIRLPKGAISYQDSAHFFSLAARVMRRILVDHARSTLTQRRGRGKKVELKDEFIYEASHPEDMLALDAALDRLEGLQPRQARVVEMRFFGGLNEEQIAQVLEVNSRTVKRDWKVAKLWLYAELSPEKPGS